jgi:hypothetical protein
MDQGIDPSVIEEVVRYMLDEGINDSRDIDYEFLDEFPELEDIDYDDSIFIPNIPIRKIRKYNNAHIVGGQSQECLAEVMIFLDALDINVKPIRKFVY